jgi:diguanylate cyclase (GGDEF)-like protein/PAS domain S-box-containing protein
LKQSRLEREALETASSLLGVESQIVEMMDHGAPLKAVLDILTAAIEKLAPECLCTVLLLDEERQQLREGSAGGLPEEYMHAIDGLAIGPEVGACGSAAYRNKPIVVEDIATDPRFAPVKDFVMSFGLRACWSVPIRGLKQNVLGTFAMYHRRPARPRDRELELVEAGGHLAANAIERLHAAERLRENEERIVLAEKAAFLGIWELDLSGQVLTLSQQLAGQVGLPDAAHRLSISQLREMIHPEDWQTVHMAWKRASTDGKLFYAEFRVVLANGVIRWLRAQASVELVDNQPKRMIGVSVDITNEKEMVESLHFQASHDGLTGIWNRKAIFDLMRREFELAARAGTTTGLLMLDFDHFKTVNDTYGHPCGDTVLYESVRRIQQVLRSSDLIGRYGGEEFLIVVPNCDREHLKWCAERARIAIAEEPLLVDGVTIPMTVSIGATVVPPSGTTEQEALSAADAALYMAKRGGRNRTVDGQPVAPSPVNDLAAHIAGASSIARNISTEKRSQIVLLEPDEQHRLLFVNNPIPMWIYDCKTLNFVAVNEAAIRQYGYTEQEFLAKSILEIRPEEDIPDVLKDIERHTPGLQNRDVWKHRRKNGEVFDVEVVCHRIDLGGVESMLVSAHDVTDRKMAEEKLQNSESKYRVLFEDSADATWLMDETGFVDWNSAALEMFGYSGESPTLHPADISPPSQPDGTDSRTAAEQRIAAAFRKGKERFEWMHQRKNGNVFPAEVSLTALTLSGRPMLVATVRDLTDQKQAEATTRQAEEKYQAIFEDSVIGIFQATPDGRPVRINRAMAQMHGYASPEELMAEVSNVAEQLFVAPHRMAGIAQAIAEHGVVHGAEIEAYRKDRTHLWLLINVRGVQDATGNLVLFEGTVEDITERKAAEERIQFLAYHDALTELPNRAILRDRLDNALSGARRRNEKVALLSLDLDRFKTVNDASGHAFGDSVLKVVAKRLRNCVGEDDTVARVGSDEFLVLLSSVRSADEAAIAAERLMDAMKPTFIVQGQSLRVSCSIGVSVSPADGEEGEILIKHAGAALRSAKESGGGNVKFFTVEMDAQVAERLTMDRNLQLALDRNEFFLVYQPQLGIESRRITGFEALIRWQQPEMGMVPPDRFISIAERNGLILPIGEWVLRTACAQARKWQMDGLPAVPVAVNVSAVQFGQASFCDLIRDVLRETGLAPEYLELELTESLLLCNADATLLILQELTDMGLKLAIDDFGTGYSSLSYLKQFPVGKLKIDRSFIRDIAADCNDAPITTAIISMAKNLRLKVIAEGVETEAQMSFLRGHECDEVQGYYFSRPLSADAAASLLIDQARVPRVEFPSESVFASIPVSA